MRRIFLILPVVVAMSLGACVVEDDSCYADEWECDNGECILDIDVCDGYDDCLDGSDEDYHACDYCVDITLWECDDGLEDIDSIDVCDGIDDCTDGSDEDYCADVVSGCLVGEFECDSGFCIDSADECDGINDCYDCTDELGC